MLLSLAITELSPHSLHLPSIFFQPVETMNTIVTATSQDFQQFPSVETSSELEQTMLLQQPMCSSIAYVASFPFNRLQRIGENLFVATFLIAFLQASVAFFSYQTNPEGELMVPPGPTVGVEKPSSIASATVQIPTIRKERDGLLASYKELVKGVSEGDSDDLSTSNISTNQSRYNRIINRANRFLPLLVPWLARKFGVLITRNTHLFHIGFVTALIKMFDFPARLFQRGDVQCEDPSNSIVVSKSLADISRVCVIGDSLSVGLGTVDVFDKNKNSTLPKYRIEHVVDDHPTSGRHHHAVEEAASPEFPSAFARALATLRQVPVSWRSAGVDGGTVEDIKRFCFGVIQEETDQARPPDVVIILCGINDLKQFMTNPFGGYSARAFRNSLTELVTNIRRLSPGCKVILPAMPTQMFHKNSALNIFPLAFFLDTIVGFFDSQKKLVADCFPSKDVMYLGLSTGDIVEWYKTENKLIAVDGVHPNKRCYALWAEAMATGLCANLVPASYSGQNASLPQRQHGVRF